MTKYKNLTLNEYTDLLSQKTPVPGGGSAAAVVASLAMALISMVANYSIKKKDQSPDIRKKIKETLRKSERLRKKLLDLSELDARAYLKVVESRSSSSAVQQKALREARKVPQELSNLCSDAIELLPFLIEKGNKFLLSDIEVAAEFLLAAFNSGVINVKVNQ